MSRRRHLRLVENWPTEDLRLLDLLLAAAFLLGVLVGAVLTWAVIG